MLLVSFGLIVVVCGVKIHMFLVSLIVAVGVIWSYCALIGVMCLHFVMLSSSY